MFWHWLGLGFIVLALSRKGLIANTTNCHQSSSRQQFCDSRGLWNLTQICSKKLWIRTWWSIKQSWKKVCRGIDKFGVSSPKYLLQFFCWIWILSKHLPYPETELFWWRSKVVTHFACEYFGVDVKVMCMTKEHGGTSHDTSPWKLSK
jgi:hypothetical protein